MTKPLTRQEVETARATTLADIEKRQREVNELALKAAIAPQYDKPLSEAREAVHRGEEKLRALAKELVAVGERERQAEIEKHAERHREDLVEAVVALHERMDAITRLDRALADAKEAAANYQTLSGSVGKLSSAPLQMAENLNSDAVSSWRRTACLRPYDTDTISHWLERVNGIPTNFAGGYEDCPARALADLKRRMPKVVDEEFEREVERRLKERES